MYYLPFMWISLGNSYETPQPIRPVVTILVRHHRVYCNPTWICVYPVPRINGPCKYVTIEKMVGTKIRTKISNPSPRPRPILGKYPWRPPHYSNNGNTTRITSNEERMFDHHPKASYNKNHELPPPTNGSNLQFEVNHFTIRILHSYNSHYSRRIIDNNSLHKFWCLTHRYHTNLESQ